MIDYLRYVMYAILIFLIVLLYQAWDKEHPNISSVTPIAVPTTVSNNNNFVPQAASKVAEQSVAKNTSSIPGKTMTPSTSDRLVHVKTDVLDVTIDALGGNISHVSLLKYPKELHSTQPVVLLNDDPNTEYLAQSGLLSTKGPDTAKGQALYSTSQKEYVLAKDQDNLQVKLFWQKQGLNITKIFTFHPNNYEIDVTYQIDNKSNEAWQGNLYFQLLRANSPPPKTQGFMNLATYFGAAIYTPDKHFKKVSFKEMAEKNLNESVTGGWAAMVQHYFVSAWVPDTNVTSQYFSQVTPNGLYAIGAVNEKKIVNPGESKTLSAKFYTGPAIADKLEKVAPGLKLTIDYGWLFFISDIIFWMMQQIYQVIGNWGWAIVLVTVIIKLLFYQLSAKSYRSMSAMKLLQPRIEQLKERYAEDKQKFTQAVMELYKKEKVNPMSGCLPMIIQIPVFIALYWVLIESVQLRQAPFILWIQDLSTKDPFYVLPVLMGLSMFLQQRLNPPPPDPMQAKVFLFMPIVFTALFINFPAGLMLYWFVNNLLSFLQQWYIMRTLDSSKKKGR